MASLHAFDTLGYTKTLVSKGYERDKAEALAEAQQEFFAREVATEDFVRSETDKVRAEIDKVRAEIKQAVDALEKKIEIENSQLENRLIKSFFKTMITCMSLLMAGIPLIVTLLPKLG